MSTLFMIEGALSDLAEARQELEEQICLTPEDIENRRAALEEVDKAIVEYVTKEIRKVDAIARYLLELGARQNAIKAERKRLGEIEDRCRRNEDRLKDLVLQIMRDTDVKKLEGKIGTLKRQGNGGVQPVDIVQPELLPNKFKRVTVTMSYEAWVRLKMAEALHTEPYGAMKIQEPEPDKEAIREALMKRETCPACEGIINTPGQFGSQGTNCYACDGEGTVPAGVPGARLLERGEHLRVT